MKAPRASPKIHIQKPFGGGREHPLKTLDGKYVQEPEHPREGECRADDGATSSFTGSTISCAGSAMDDLPDTMDKDFNVVCGVSSLPSACAC